MSFQTQLLRWYKVHQRLLPWRQSKDPYRILLSEVMLQQTQVQTVIPYYHRFLKAFPTFKSLANAPLNRVLKLWEGLGYYSRARNLHALAKTVTRELQGKLPSTYDEIIRLPGIGRYTAGAVLSIAFDQDVPLVDGNVQRVFARHFGIRKDISTTETQRALWKLAEQLLPHGQAGTFNQALMELGALICTPQNPECPRCPVRNSCKARRWNLQNELPIKKKGKPVPHVQIGAGVIWKDDKILISQRPLKGLLGGLWEFPGGKQEPGESIRDCVRREIKEELDVNVRVGPKIAEVDHAYSHFKITLHAHECRFLSGRPKTNGCEAWQWVTPRELKNFAFPGANQPIIAKLLES